MTAVKSRQIPAGSPPARQLANGDHHAPKPPDPPKIKIFQP